MTQSRRSRPVAKWGATTGFALSVVMTVFNALTSVSWGSPEGHVCVYLQRGAFHCCWTWPQYVRAGEPGWSWGSHDLFFPLAPPGRISRVLGTSANFVGLTGRDCSAAEYRVGRAGYMLSLPLWLLVGVTFAASLALWRLDISRRISTSRCQSCGYDLTGNVSGRCPECGHAMDGGGGHAISN